MGQAVEADPNYRRLESKHRELSERLEELQHKRFLTADEELEETRIKKMKLVLKDQMEALARSVGR